MAFLVGVAAAAVILVMPAYVLHDVDFSRAVLIAEGVAVSALVMCLGFVMANSPGFPWKWWRLLPVVGLLNWPSSMLAWDVIAERLPVAEPRHPVLHPLQPLRRA